MFKYLLLKSIYDLSDVNVVERSRYDIGSMLVLVVWTRKMEQPIISSERAKEMFSIAKNQKHYILEFKQQILDLYNAGGTSYPQLEREYGVNQSTLSSWVKTVVTYQGIRG